MASVEVAEKLCNGCGVCKPLSQFYKDKTSTDGHASRCKVCARQAIDENRQRFIAEHGLEAWLEKNREITRKHRERTGNATGKRYGKQQRRAISALIERHRKEYDHLLLLARRGEPETEVNE